MPARLPDSRKQEKRTTLKVKMAETVQFSQN